MNKKQIFFYFLLIVGVLTVTGRRRKAPKLQNIPFYRSLVENVNEVTSVVAEDIPRARKAPKLHKIPLYRSLVEEDVEDVTSAMTEDVPQVTSKTKVFLIKPREEEANEGRFFKHFLLYKSLLQPSASHPSSFPSYLIINTPTNLTNINNNTLTNITATRTTPTGTGTGTGGAGRIVYIRDNQALPMPTQVYQQRQQAMPQIVYGVPLNSVNQNKRRRNRFGNRNGNAYRKPNRKSNNPFSAFANRLRNVQFF